MFIRKFRDLFYYQALTEKITFRFKPQNEYFDRKYRRYLNLMLSTHK